MANTRAFFSFPIIPLDIRIGKINELIHGGQGTVQTAGGAGTPIVAVGMQVEQCTNLDSVANSGTGIRIPKRQWNPKNIRQAVSRVPEVLSYRRGAARLKSEHDSRDGRHEAAWAIWDFMDSNTP